jgi:hypothetical protein
MESISKSGHMKILKYILFVIIGLVVIFFAIGLMTPSVSYGHTITVNKSVEEAWAVSKDTTKFDQWLDGFKSMTLISGEADEVGSTYKIIVNPGEGQADFEMIETIVSKKEFEHINLHFDSEMMDFDQLLTFKGSGGQTTITTESTVSGKGVVLRSMFALMEKLGGAFQSQEEKNQEALKRVIEENTTDYYPSPEMTEEEVLELHNESEDEID